MHIACKWLYLLYNCMLTTQKAINGSEVILFIVLALKGCHARNVEAIPLVSAVPCILHLLIQL